MIVQTMTGKRGTVIDATRPGTPRESARIFLRLWLHVGPKSGLGVPAKVIVAYAPEDVREVRGQAGE